MLEQLYSLGVGALCAGAFGLLVVLVGIIVAGWETFTKRWPATHAALQLLWAGIWIAALLWAVGSCYLGKLSLR